MTRAADDAQTRAGSSLWTSAIVLSGVALLSFLARTFVDYRYVYAELGFDTSALGLMILVHSVYIGGWVWAIVAATRGRRAMYVLLAYDVILLVWAFYTLAALCPSPCRTGWPIGEISIWSNLATGVPAAALAVVGLLRRAGSVPKAG